MILYKQILNFHEKGEINYKLESLGLGNISLQVDMLCNIHTYSRLHLGCSVLILMKKKATKLAYFFLIISFMGLPLVIAILAMLNTVVYSKARIKCCVSKRTAPDGAHLYLVQPIQINQEGKYCPVYVVDNVHADE